MKKYYLLAVLLIVVTSTFVQAQQNVGIGTTAFTPSANSMLEVRATDAGVLVPRMTSAQRVLINPAVSPPGNDYGLLVYQTDGGVDVAGYWYWDGTAWTRLFNGTVTGWALTGNALTGGSSITPNEWIGSSNAYDWVIKTNNTERMRILSTSEVGINTTPVINTQLKVILSGSTANGRGIYCENTSTGGTGQTAIYGYKSGVSAGDGYGIYGLSSGASNNNFGGSFYAWGGATANYGIFAEAISDVLTGYGVYGRSSMTGISGQYGVYGQKNGDLPSGNGYGVYGTATGTGTNNYGAYFTATGATTNYGSYSNVSGNAATNYGCYANNLATGSTNQYGMYAVKTGAIGVGTGYGAFGRAMGAASSNIGGYFQALDGTTNYGVWGSTTGNAATNYAVRGDNQSTGAINQYALYGTKTGVMAGGSGYGVYASASGTATNNYGAYLTATGATNNYSIIVPSGGGRVGIGTITPSAKSIMELSSTAAGILIPRMLAADKTAIAPGAGANDGLLIYQTDGTEGFYYWDGAAWVMIASGSGSGWSLTGNAGTNPGTYFVPGTNFIGTTDVQDFVIKTSAVAGTPLERMRVKTTGEIGINCDASTNNQLKVALTGSTGSGRCIYATNSSTGAGQVGIASYKSGNMGSGNGIAVYGDASGAADRNYGADFRADGGTISAYGVSGFVSGTTQIGYGVMGQSQAGTISQFGVYGEKSGADAGVQGYGVYGSAINAAAANYGGYFSASGGTWNYGVMGRAPGTAVTNYAVYGYNTATGTTAQYALYGRKDGVMAAGSGYGVYGEALNGAAANYGGYFTASGATVNYPLFVDIPDNNTNGITARINVANASITAADYFMSFNSSAGSIGGIQGTTGSPGLITYATFTGSHYSVIDNRNGLEPNVLLEATGEKFDTDQGQLVKAKICSTKKSKAVYGVWGGQNPDGKDLVLSIGTGYIWVANKGQDIEVGDFLMSSDVKGCAEKQDTPGYDNFTAAKAMESIKWKEGEKKRLIACIYLGG